MRKTNYKLITCQRCGKKQWRWPTSKYCFDCGSGRPSCKECFFCKKKSGLELHHLEYNTTGNLICLCVSCHRKLHSKVYKSIYQIIFPILVKERYSYKEIGKMFHMTKQNVEKLLRTR